MGEALRDYTKDGCVKDKPTTSLLLISVFMMLKKTTNKFSQSWHKTLLSGAFWLGSCSFLGELVLRSQ